MKVIEITRGLSAIVDDEDYDLVAHRRWQAKPAVRQVEGKTAWYAQAQFDRRTVFMHRLILGAEKGQEVDHINGNGLDNRRANLRFCNRSQNSANTRRDPPKSGFRGVYSDKRLWAARISINGRRRSLGMFEDPADAARAYDAAAKEAFGEFATLNFPPHANNNEAALQDTAA